MASAAARVTRRWGGPALLLVATVAAWEGVVALAALPHYILPAPSRIARVLAAEAPLLARHASVTAVEVLVGFGLALVAGLALGFAMFASRALARALEPLLVASQTVPVFAVAPLLVLWLGYGLASKVTMAALIVFFPMAMATLDGLRSADPDLLAWFRMARARPTTVLLAVRIPAALPFVFSGMRIGAGVSVIGAVIGEWVGADAGLGYLMAKANAQLRVDLVFASLVVLSVFGIGLVAAVRGLEWLATPWRRAALVEGSR
ncbi:MAG TPA: ABC transporter permease [Thermodesulfobacteriota bacterium]|nr:ABC transporter permease [Thermodesulfobacteriota bacterium]